MYNNLSSPASPTIVPTQRRTRVGICAIERKAKCRPMKEILSRINKDNEFELVYFDDEMIFNEPVESWPLVDVLICFFSQRFPLQKALEYSTLRKVFNVNNVPLQTLLQDRVKMYRSLEAYGVPVPNYVYVKEGQSADDVIETEDYVEIDGNRIHKPFVEKPVDALNHNVAVYYPQKDGGGARFLFRKVGNRSSQYFPDRHTIRRDQRYLYEEFFPTEKSRDIKVYAVGLDFAHAEARKSPVVDGIVERLPDGKERRYPGTDDCARFLQMLCGFCNIGIALCAVVVLSEHEMDISRRVLTAFRQAICGFDLLRHNGKPYVCDVNGWSMVKSSTRYYDECATRLKRIIRYRRKWVVGTHPSLSERQSSVQLRGLIAIFRHGDRTPKQKIKVKATLGPVREFFEKRIAELEAGKKKWKGDVREVKLVMRHKHEAALVEEFEHVLRRAIDESTGVKDRALQQLNEMVTVLKEKYLGLKIQMKCAIGSDTILLICKWGGQLTAAGGTEGEDLGGLLRESLLHESGEYMRTFMDGIRVYSSDEARVIHTAEHFTMTFNGETCQKPPAELVQIDKTLNDISVAKRRIEQMKGRLESYVVSDDEYVDDGQPTRAELERLGGVLIPDIDPSVYTDEDELRVVSKLGLARVGRPLQLLNEIHQLIGEYIEHLEDVMRYTDSKSMFSEPPELVLRRWKKLHLDLYDVHHEDNESGFNVSKINDLYDSARYELLHHFQLFRNFQPLYTKSKLLADFLVPSEYGITLLEKYQIGFDVCRDLFKRFLSAFDEMKAPIDGEPVSRCRLYFTSESQLHAFLNVLVFRGLPGMSTFSSNFGYCLGLAEKEEPLELSFLTHIVFRLYEDTALEEDDPNRWFLRIEFSPGLSDAMHVPPEYIQSAHSFPVQALRLLYERLPLHELNFVRNTKRFSG